MFIKHVTDPDAVIGGPDGTLEPDFRGAFLVPAETGAALLRLGGWTEVGPHVEPEPEPEPEPVKAPAKAAPKTAK